MTGSLTGTSEAGALPVYMQIAELLSRQIDAGILVEGQRLPPEREMAKQHGVAVGTLRKSLARLTAMGRLTRRQGSGNYIQRSDDQGAIYAMFRLELPSGGGLPSAQLLSTERLKSPPKPATLSWDGPSHRFRRVRFLDGKPVAIEEIWLDAEMASTVDPDRVSQSLYRFYRDELGLWIMRTEDSVALAPLPGWAVDHFPLAPGSPVGYVERRGWSQHDRQVEFSRTWFDPEMSRFVARQG
ncbi:MAG: GntR family transcriptional regulator [Pseudomonadota bacterium]|nr:GntR family transcriptional regulator [Pseudomonadota bacterium]